MCGFLVEGMWPRGRCLRYCKKTGVRIISKEGKELLDAVIRPESVPVFIRTSTFVGKRNKCTNIHVVTTYN